MLLREEKKEVLFPPVNFLNTELLHSFFTQAVRSECCMVQSFAHVICSSFVVRVERRWRWEVLSFDGSTDWKFLLQKLFFSFFLSRGNEVHHV